jgi:hypothetical protein
VNEISDIPILIVAFNRPQLLVDLISELKLLAPKKVYVAIDGPRVGFLEDHKLVLESREACSLIDWDCSLETKFETKNLGCGKSVSQAISWAFKKEEKLIILEDDIRPDPSFFYFCHELLNKYQDVDEVISISGSNFLGDGKIRDSYRFSSITHVWGWATWSRAWKNYEFDLAENSTRLSIKKIKLHFDCSWIEASAISFLLRQVARKKIDTWDYQLLHMALTQGGLSATSNVNLTTNVGFGKTATHTIEAPKYILSTENMNFPLIHPSLTRDFSADKWIIENAYGVNLQAIIFALFRKAKKLFLG